MFLRRLTDELICLWLAKYLSGLDEKSWLAGVRGVGETAADRSDSTDAHRRYDADEEGIFHKGSATLTSYSGLVLAGI